MKIGVFQMKTSASLAVNYTKIMEAIQIAAHENVRLLVFPECALCGYPPVEVESVVCIDFNQVDKCLNGLKNLAGKYGMYVAVGTVRKDTRYYNSIVLIGPDGSTAGIYDKRALWGWDIDNFAPGTSDGIFNIDDVRVAFRICFEIRFPEYFREAFKAQAELCFVSFCDVSAESIPQRYELLKAHLMTRACENVMPVISVNSISQCQTAPTAVFSPEGMMLYEAPRDIEHLLVYDYKKPEALGVRDNGKKAYCRKAGAWRKRSGAISLSLPYRAKQPRVDDKACVVELVGAGG